MSDLHALAALVRRDPRDAPIDVSPELIDLAIAQGLDALAARSSSAGLLKARLAGHEALAALRDRELRAVLDALAAERIRPVVIKGAHLAHVLYASPGLRPRADTDLVIDGAARAPMRSALARIGYAPAIHVRGTVILGQHHYQRIDAAGVAHALDVHWRIASPLVFKRVLEADVLHSEAVPIPALGPAAFGPGLPHALAIACVHLMAHHRRDAILLWLFEIAELAKRLDAGGAGRFTWYARQYGIAELCAAALARARAYFDNAQVSELSDRLAAGRGEHEPSARLLAAETAFAELRLDLRASDGWRERATLLKEHVWPDAAYMRAVHGMPPGASRAGWLPLLYLRRAAAGAIRWTRPSANRTAGSAEPRADSAAAFPSPARAKTSR